MDIAQSIAVICIFRQPRARMSYSDSYYRQYERRGGETTVNTILDNLSKVTWAGCMTTVGCFLVGPKN